VSSVPASSEPGAQPDQSAPPRDRLKSVRQAAAVLWTILILALCWLPRQYVHEIEGDSSWFRVPNLDKIVHCGIFVVFSILWLRLATSRRAKWAVLLGGLALGALSELGQLLPIVGRDAELYDFATDSVGVVIGVLVAPLVEPLIRFVECRLFREPAAGLRPAEPAAVEQ
jgi:VanZ family protein